jgi:hypothetical protein
MSNTDFKVGDLVEIVNWGENDGSGVPRTDADKRYDGTIGPITNILRDGTTIFVDVREPGIFFNDLICYPHELKKVETNG